MSTPDDWYMDKIRAEATLAKVREQCIAARTAGLGTVLVCTLEHILDESEARQ